MTDLVCDAKLLSQHARKRTIDAEDARLSALQMAEKYVSAPPARHVISQVTWDNHHKSVLRHNSTFYSLQSLRTASLCPHLRVVTAPDFPQTDSVSLQQTFDSSPAKRK